MLAIAKNCNSVGLALLLGVMALAVGVTPGVAGPFDPDYRGDANSIHAIFDWASPATDWDLTLFETGPSAYPLDPTVPEAFDDGTNPTIIFPNFIDPLPYKLVRLQFFFDGQVPGELIDVFVAPHDPLATVVVELDRSVGLANEHFIDWEIRPNPDWEEFFITGNTAVGIIPGNLLEFEIDTISLPEPSTLVLLGVGLVGLVGCVRR